MFRGTLYAIIAACLAMLATMDWVAEGNPAFAKVAEAMGGENASIFEAHLLVLEDRTLIDEVIRIRTEERGEKAI